VFSCLSLFGRSALFWIWSCNIVNLTCLLRFQEF
jgi:hypothetical protein